MKCLIILFLLCAHCYAKGQIQLLNCEVSTCQGDPSSFKLYPEYHLKTINDSIIRIQTRILANCIGVYHPRIKEYGPIVNLNFDNFRMDSINPLTNKKEPTPIETNCLCTYDIKWDILGLTQDTARIFLIRGRIFKNYPIEHLDELLYSYELGNGQLINVYDKDKNRQGCHRSINENSQPIYYKDDMPEK